MRAGCSPNIVIESDGSVYPCDFYTEDKWKLGNLKDQTIQEIYSKEKAHRFINESKYISSECKECQYLSICKGGCKRNYEPLEENPLRKNYFCMAYKEFYKHSLPRFYEILKLKSRRFA